MRRFGLLSIFALLVLAPLAVAHDVPSKTTFGPAERDFTQRHLSIHLRPDLEAGRVGGRVELRFESLVERLETLRLHCVDTQVHGVHGASGGFLGWSLDKGILTIRLEGALERGQESNVVIEYTSTPTRGLYFHRPTKAHPDVPVCMYSQGQGADNRRWIPCYDHPDDRCSWDLFVEVPTALTTISNGTLQSQEALGGGLRLDHWSFPDRAPTYLISLIVGDLTTIKETWDDVQVVYAAPKGCAPESELRRALDMTPDVLAFFSEYTGVKYPWASYTQTLVWDFVYGGMENVTATTLNMRVLHTDAARPTYRSDALVAHEAAHMWFGDLLTCRTWPHLWLNEGFATYFTDLYFEHAYGQEEFLLRRRDQNTRYMDGTPKPHELKIEPNPRGDTPLELGGLKAYNRGSVILHMLRRELGDTVFQTAVNEWVTRHRDEAVVSEQLRRVFEDVSGRDLAWFFDQWVYGVGYPTLEVELDEGELVVRQVQPTTATMGPFRLTVPMRWSLDGKLRNLRVYKAEHRFPLLTEADVMALVDRAAEGDLPAAHWVRVNVGGDLLMRVTVKQPMPSWIAMLGGEPDLTGRMDAALALETFSEAAVPALARALDSDPSWAVRRTCAEVLGRIGGAGSVLALRPATDDSDPRVRVAVCDGLAKSTRAHAGSTMVALAAEDPNPYVRAAAARAVGRLKVPGALELFRLMLGVDSHVDTVRQGALDGLRLLGDPAGIGLATPFTGYRWGKGQTHQVRKTALECATALGPDDERVHALLMALLDDPYHRMRQWAAAACGTYGVEEAIAALERLEKNDWNGGGRGAAHRALTRLRPEPAKTR